MELRLSLGPDEYGAAGKKMMSRERDVGLMEFHLGLGGRRPPEEAISSDPTSEDRSLPLLLPLLGGRRNLGEIAEQSKEGTVSRAERKKLRLSKEQSSFLEQCFREHHTLTSVSDWSYHVTRIIVDNLCIIDFTSLVPGIGRAMFPSVFSSLEIKKKITRKYSNNSFPLKNGKLALYSFLARLWSLLVT